MLRHPYFIACVFALVVVAVILPGTTTLVGNIIASAIGLVSGVAAALLAARGA